MMQGPRVDPGCIWHYECHKMEMLKSLAKVLVVLSLAALVACGDHDGGPDDPIEARIDELFPEDLAFGTLDREQLRAMMLVAPEADGPFYMVNLIRHRERAAYPDGRESALSGREADELYGALIFPILLEIGAVPIFVADVEAPLIDDDGAAWTQVGIVRYPSRAAFVEFLGRKDVREAAVHKRAGVEQTTVLVTNESATRFPASLRSVDLDSLPFPPSEEDPPLAIVHLLRFNEIAQYADGRETGLSGREAMALYEQGRQAQGVLQLGVRPGIWLEVEGEFIGDGRTWHELRINNFPSRASFARVITNESLEEAGIEHRAAALAATYALQTAPMINQVGYE